MSQGQSPADDLSAALSEQARALVPALIERAERANRERRIPAETMAAIRASGMLRVLQPRRFGGMGGDYPAFASAIHELAQGCASTAWVYGVLGEHQWVLSMFPEATQVEVWGANPEAVASSSFAPAGTARQVDGGHEISGRWSFSSGCDFAQWAIVG